jgi:hypothetical protein
LRELKEQRKSKAQLEKMELKKKAKAERRALKNDEQDKMDVPFEDLPRKM